MKICQVFQKVFNFYLEIFRFKDKNSSGRGRHTNTLFRLQLELFVLLHHRQIENTNKIATLEYTLLRTQTKSICFFFLVFNQRDFSGTRRRVFYFTTFHRLAYTSQSFFPFAKRFAPKTKHKAGHETKKTAQKLAEPTRLLTNGKRRDLFELSLLRKRFSSVVLHVRIRMRKLYTDTNSNIKIEPETGCSWLRKGEVFFLFFVFVPCHAFHCTRIFLLSSIDVLLGHLIYEIPTRTKVQFEFFFFFWGTYLIPLSTKVCTIIDLKTSTKFHITI